MESFVSIPANSLRRNYIGNYRANPSMTRTGHGANACSCWLHIALNTFFTFAYLYTRNAKPHTNCWKRSSLFNTVLPAKHLAWNRRRHSGIHPAWICASGLRNVLRTQQLQSNPVEIYSLMPDAARFSASGMLRAEYQLP